MFIWKTRKYHRKIKAKLFKNTYPSLPSGRDRSKQQKSVKEYQKIWCSIFQSPACLSDCQSPCTTLSTQMPLSPPVSLSSVSWSWIDICQLYRSGYFDVARYDLTHYHTRHESIFRIDNKICSCHIQPPFFSLAYAVSYDSVWCYICSFCNWYGTLL